jgi:Predicted membrane protein
MRLAAKTASWSLVHMTVAIAVAYALTQNWRAALAVGLIEPIFQTIAFALHERAWTRLAPARAVARPRIADRAHA